MRRSPLDEARRWLSQAAIDLRWAQLLAEQGAHHLACFLSQQVAAQGQEIVLGHSVERLCSAAAAYDPAITEKARQWSLLDGYYISTRYPNALPDGIPADVFTAEAAQSAVAMAAAAVDYVRGRVDPPPP